MRPPTGREVPECEPWSWRLGQVRVPFWVYFLIHLEDMGIDLGLGV